jgi:hypothetical protein
VYYLPQWWLKNGLPHFFIVMNEDPKRDTITLAYVVTSQVEKVEERIRLRCRPEETLVYIHKGTSIERFDKRFVFDKPSIVDCNSCIDFSRSEFEAAMKQAMQEKGPVWIECEIDREEKVLPMIPSGGTVHDTKFN